jgi:hypothetical protein
VQQLGRASVKHSIAYWVRYFEVQVTIYKHDVYGDDGFDYCSARFQLINVRMRVMIDGSWILVVQLIYLHRLVGVLSCVFVMLVNGGDNFCAFVVR